MDMNRYKTECVLKLENTPFADMADLVDNCRRENPAELTPAPELDFARLLHGAIGVVTESAELLEGLLVSAGGAQIDATNLKEEIGDVLFYLVLGYDAVGADADHIAITVRSATGPSGLRHAAVLLSTKAGELMDECKRCLFYGKKPDLTKIKERLSAVTEMLDKVLVASGLTIQQVAEANVNKLSVRYGDKFSKDAALSRDSDAERKALEA